MSDQHARSREEVGSRRNLEARDEEDTRVPLGGAIACPALEEQIGLGTIELLLELERLANTTSLNVCFTQQVQNRAYGKGHRPMDMSYTMLKKTIEGMLIKVHPDKIRGAFNALSVEQQEQNSLDDMMKFGAKAHGVLKKRGLEGLLTKLLTDRRSLMPWPRRTEIGHVPVPLFTS